MHMLKRCDYIINSYFQLLCVVISFSEFIGSVIRMGSLVANGKVCFLSVLLYRCLPFVVAVDDSTWRINSSLFSL